MTRHRFHFLAAHFLAFAQPIIGFAGLALTVAVLVFAPINALTSWLLMAGASPLILLALPNASERREFWLRLSARDPSARRTN